MIAASTGPATRFGHIDSLTDRFGTFEHAEHADARAEHGYCTDDVARLLVVAAREPDRTLLVRQLTRGAFRFVAESQGVTGDTRNRRDARGRWHGRRTVEDCWGRSLWAFGVTAQHGEGWLAQDALASFEHGTQRRSPWRRSMAYAALGAAAVLEAHPRHSRAATLLADAAQHVGPVEADATWPWPEARLTYANAVLPEALLAAGSALGRPELVEDGLQLLRWLLERQTVDGHLSLTPAGGVGPGDPHGFDQQPIEAAALAEACARAVSVTGDLRWSDGVRMAAAWFDGDNDSATPMWDAVTGGGYDGLERDGANQNQGAESTLALIAVRQLADGLGVAA